MLTDKQIEAYKQAGYLKVEGLFTPQEVEELNSEMRPVGLAAKEPNNKTVVSGLKKRREEPQLTYR